MTAQKGLALEVETRPIPGFLGYRATIEGTVLGKDGRVLRPRPHRRTGHLRVRLYGGASLPRAIERGGQLHLERFTDIYVHVAVCLAFHGPPPFPGALVLHEDDVPSHNWPANLRWGGRLENAEDARRNHAVDDQGFDWSTGEEAA